MQDTRTNGLRQATPIPGYARHLKLENTMTYVYYLKPIRMPEDEGHDVPLPFEGVAQ
jgi:hypothetical protein